jgi:hypothetical protein
MSVDFKREESLRLISPCGILVVVAVLVVVVIVAVAVDFALTVHISLGSCEVVGLHHGCPDRVLLRVLLTFSGVWAVL